MSYGKNTLPKFRDIHTIFHKHKFTGIGLVLAALAITTVVSWAATSGNYTNSGAGTATPAANATDVLVLDVTMPDAWNGTASTADIVKKAGSAAIWQGDVLNSFTALGSVTGVGYEEDGTGGFQGTEPVVRDLDADSAYTSAADTLIDGDGSTTTGAGAVSGSLAAGDPLLAMGDNIATGANAVCTNSLTAPTALRIDTNGNCGGGGNEGTYILGAFPTASTIEVTSAWVFGDAVTSGGNANGTYDNGEDIFRDGLTPAKLTYSTGADTDVYTTGGLAAGDAIINFAADCDGGGAGTQACKFTGSSPIASTASILVDQGNKGGAAPNSVVDKQADQLIGMGVQNTGTAVNSSDISAVKVWVDAGAAGFQGTGTDTALGTMTVNSGDNKEWRLGGLTQAILAGGQRIFVSADIAATPTGGRTMIFQIPVFNDAGANGIVSADNDRGVFVSSNNDGPTDSAVLNASTQTITLDVTAPTFTIQYYSDSGLTTSLGDNPKLKAGTYYLKITSNEALSGTPTVSIGAEGTANDEINAATTFDAGNDYKYTRTISFDAAAVGSVLENLSVTGTDSATNTASNVDPTNEATKAAYTDTTVPTLSPVTIASNNAVTTKAKVGDTVTVSFTSSESVLTPTATVGVGAATVSGGPTSWTASRVMSAGDSEGTVPFTVDFTDLAGNNGTQVTAITSGSNVTFDKTAPTFAIQYYSDSGLTTPLSDNPRLDAGTYYIKITSNEALSTTPTISIAAEGTNNDELNAITTAVSGNDYKYTRTIVSDGSAVGTTLEDISVSGTDATGNTATNVDPTNEASKAAYTDTTAPTFSIQYFSDLALTTVLPDNTSLKTGTYYLRITANEALTGTPTVTIGAEGTANDVINAASTLVAGNNYRHNRVIAFDAAAIGSVLENLSVSGTDAAGNTATDVNPTNEAAKAAYTDTVVPTVTDLSSTAPDPTNTSPIPVSVTFSEKVGQTSAAYGDLDGSEFSVVNGVVGSFLNSGDDKTYTFDVTPSGQGVVTIDVNSNVVFDAANNGNTAATQLSRTFDSVQPTVIISSTTTNPTNDSPIPVTVTFSEDVTGFDNTDVVVGNGTKSNFTPVSGSVYTLDVTPTCQCVVTVDVAAAVAQDDGLNDNSVAVQLTRTYDTTAPILAETTPVPTFTNVNTPSYTFSSDEAGNIIYGGDCSSALTPSAAAGSNPITFDTLGDGLHSNCTIVVTDAAGNSSLTLDVSDFTVDTAAPSVVLSSTAPDPTNLTAIPFTALFSEDVTGLLDTEISVTNGTVSNFLGSGSSYTFDVNPTIDGLVDVQIPANMAQDAAGNDNTISNLESRTVDTVAPTITAAEVKDTNADGKVDRIDLTFDDNLADTAAGSNGFDVSSASDHGTCNSESANPDGTSTLILTFTCSNVETSVGDLTLDLTANAGVKDAVGNNVATVNLDAFSVPAITDSASPIVVSTTPADGAAGVVVGSNVIVTFSEPMNTGSLVLTDDDSNNYTGTTWSGGDRIVEASHDDWTASAAIDASVDADDLNALPLNGGTFNWSFLTQAPANQGQITIPSSNVVTNGAGLDLSLGVSTAGGGDILIDAVLQPLVNIVTGDLAGVDLSVPQMVGDQSTTVSQAVTLHSTGDITITNAALPGTTMTIPNGTTLFCDGAWDGTLVLRSGVSSGTAPTGFSIGGLVVEAGSPGCSLLLDQPITLTMAGVTGPVAFKPAGSAVWSTIGTCGGTYAAPTLAAPLPFGECAISNGANTKIVTYHLTNFGQLLSVPPGGAGSTVNLIGVGGSKFAKPSCSGQECFPTIPEVEKVALKCFREATTIVPFTDISSHWGKNYIESLYRQCIVDGKSQNQFAPEANVTRAELIKIVINVFNPGTTPFKQFYTDVNESDWFAPYVMQATRLHLVMGVKINRSTFLHPNNIITRAEAIAMILKAKGVLLGTFQSTFSDIKQTDQYYASIAFAQAKGLVIGKAQTLQKSGLVSKFYSFEDLYAAQKDKRVEILKELMAQLDYYRGEINAQADDALIAAIRTYQKAKGLEVTGEMNTPTTEALLREFLNPKVIRYFEPGRPITRAEITKLVKLAQDL